jgi:SAM-dependent methyltransferase
MSTAPFISRKTGQFAYFAAQLGQWDWRRRDVLDFGGNIGNMLRDPESTIDSRRYWCLDVVEESIARGRERWPEAHWRFYDRYCFFFNPRGVPRLPLPELGQTFNIIAAYSVFTNTDRTDMMQLVEQLQAMLAPGGSLAFTYIDPHHRSWREDERSNFRWRLEKERGEVSSPAAREMLQRSRDAEWCILVNGEDLYLETEELPPYRVEEQKTHHTFYTTGYLRKLFPRASFRPPVYGETHHCCIIRKAS